MKILYDHQIFSSQNYGGVSRYFYELIREFNNMDDIETDLSLLLSNNYYISDKKFVKYVNFLPNKYFRGKQRLFNLLNKPNSILKLKQQNFDLFHPTYYDPYFLKYIRDKPFVLTVHDMIHEKFSDMFSSNDKITHQKRLLVEKATKVIAISENTKKDIMEIFGMDKAKIEVIYHGNSMFPKLNADIRHKVPKNYLLFVGSRDGYKNFERFIKSIASLLRQKRELFIVCAGGGKLKLGEMKLLLNLDIIKQVLQYNLDDESLAFFYTNALVFVFPSFYEGFGIPILEAFACGCPVICSNVGSLPEIASDGAYYFDPYIEESIKNAVLNILENSSLRENLILNGYKRLKKFSWKQSAEQTRKVYKSLLS